MKLSLIKDKTRFIAFTAMSTALVAAMTMVSMPISGGEGNINLGDAFIYLTAFFFGGLPAMIAGSIGASLADIILGGAQYAPFTLVIKACMGIAAGILFTFVKKYEKAFTKTLFVRFAAVLPCTLIMVTGYFFTNFILYGIKEATSMVVFDFVQAGISIVIFLAASLSLDNTKFQINKYIDK